MLSINIWRTVFGQTYSLGVKSSNGESIRRNVYKKLQTFEDCVFQQTDKCTISNNNENHKDCDAQQNLQNENTIFENNYKKQQNDCNYNKEYEEAVKTLNSLQSNAEFLRSSLYQRKRLNSLQDTKRYLFKSGLTIEDLEKLSYIHVSGTKGKGSTCALVDSILRCYGVKTGFFSSPHLISVTERLRINGKPISKQKFTEYFWTVYNKFKSCQDYENDMPAYFMFLTVLSFHVYMTEKVDVAIIEVGIGGELDCTNIITNTKTVGITPLGLEHTQLLGSTLKEIAWQKAGIIKPNSSVYTSVTQEECLEVIKRRAEEKQSRMYRVPDFESYFENPKLEKVKNQINKCTVINGSLALQLAYDWLRQNGKGFHRDYAINKPFLTEEAKRGIMNCNWPGRCQKIKFFNFNIHLDGAHTVESMQVCGSWFAQEISNSSVPKILIFNTTGERDSKRLLTILREFTKFDLVCFVPNIASLASLNTNSALHIQVEQLKRAQINLTSWQELCQDHEQTNSAKTFTSIEQCFRHIRQTYEKVQELNILVTGSIHLIGATILALNGLSSEIGVESA